MAETIQTKLDLIKVLKQVFDDFMAEEYRMACGQGCAVCCTHNLTGTTLESWEMLEALEKAGRRDLLEKVKETAKGKIYRPRLTLNTLAMYCLSHREPPSEEPEPEPQPCPLLEDSCCPIYEARPFTCRSMFSLKRCQAGQEAEIPQELISIVNTCMQMIEHMDAGGSYGNLLDLITALSDEKKEGKYKNGEHLVIMGVPPTKPVPGFLIPEEDTQTVNRFLKKLFEADCQGENFREKMAKQRENPF